MKNSALAEWLEQSIDRIAPAGGAMGQVMVEGMLRLASSDSPNLLRSVLDSAAHNAVADNQPIEGLLANLHGLKVQVWECLEEEIDPGLAWEMLLTLEDIFKLAFSVTVDSYISALNQAHQIGLAESAKIHQAAEQQVFDYAARLARANRELAKIEQAKTDFISIAAHELKTPLSVVMGYVKILVEQREKILKENADTVFDGIINGANRLQVIINNLLDISALEMDSFVFTSGPVAVGNIIKSVVKNAESDAQLRQHTLVVNIKADLPLITSDGQRLYQVLAQLVNNAIKYTPDGGRIEIGAYLDAAKQGQECIHIEVGDTGIGIAPEDWEQIFDKFYRVGDADLHSSGTVKFKGAGPGLGLSIARGIIVSLKGEIWVESSGYDETNLPGSTFHIRLPLAI